ncbi:MAG: biotin/lipoate A/B protein ligase family protein [bacterium]
MPIRLVDAGRVPYLRSQTVYHGVAASRTDESPDTILFVYPEEPYVCIGLHQELKKEVDVEFCRANNIPVVRREVGGGAVYLDSDQLFTQWVIHPDRLPMRLDRRFELFAKPLVETYKTLDIEAYFRPINDIQVGGKKIGGTGAAAIGNAEVLVGSFMFDFNYELMASVLKVPNEKFRDKIYQSLHEYMTTMKRELGAAPSRELVKDLYIQQCEDVLGDKIVKGNFTDAELRAMADYDSKFTSEEWLNQKGGLKRSGVKIHTDVWVYETTHKAKGGLIRTTVRVKNHRIDDITFTGDFTFHPPDKLQDLERMLMHSEMKSASLSGLLRDFYVTSEIQSPGVEPDDWVNAIMKVNELKQQNAEARVETA